MSSKLEAALTWARKGHRVFPLQEDSKLPLDIAWTLSATTEEAVIRGWWVDPVLGCERDYNVAALTTDWIVADIDVKDGKPGLETMARLGLEFDTRCVRTPTGGYHLYYRGLKEPTGQSPLGVGVDIRAMNGFVVAPGSTIGGVPYEVELDLPVADFPEHLRHLLKVPRRRADVVPADVDLDAPEAVELVAHWLLHDAPPAVEGENGDDTTYRVCCRIRDFGVSENQGLELFLDEYNGRCSPPWSVDEARAKMENAYRYATGTAGASSPVAAFGHVEHVTLSKKEDTVEHYTWETPDTSLLGSGRRHAPKFPMSVLGPFWSTWASTSAAAASAPPDYVCVSLLAIIGAALANVRWPLAGATWSEPPLLWVGNVGQPSSGKSPGIDKAVDLLRHAESRMCEGFDEVLQDYITQKQKAKIKLDCWEAALKTATKSGEDDPPKPDDAKEPLEPVRPRLHVADCTVEKLAALAASLPRGLLVVRDELAGWIGAFDKYGGGGSDRAFAVEMYGGRSYRVDRVKNPEPISINRLSVGVLGGVQPDKLSILTDGPDDGLTARILWAWPDASPSFKLAREHIDSTEAKAAFMRLVGLPLGLDEFGQSKPQLIRLTRDAEDELEIFSQRMMQRGSEAYGLLAGALGKVRGHTLRLSTVFEYLWWSSTGGAEPTVISLVAMKAAASIVEEYFIPMAERVYGDAVIPKVERSAMILVAYLKRNMLSTFNARDTRRKIGGMLRESRDMLAACNTLEEAGLIKQEFARVGEQKGRRALTYGVHPLVLRGAA